MTAPLLSVRNLRTEFTTDAGVVHAVDDVSFDIYPNDVFAVVGESGSGKTVTALSILDLVPKPHGRIVGGEILFRGEDILKMTPEALERLRGDRIAMVFQDPLTSLNPTMTVGSQIAEVFRVHRDTSKREAAQRAVDLLALVGIPQAAQRAQEYPHNFSGGMRQRAMIAMAVALNPDLLIADEPTTALDVTIQAQVLEVLLKVKEEFEAAIMLITHDLAVVAGVANRVTVMYAGRIAETGTTEEIYYQPKHPYTWGLMSSMARRDVEGKQRLTPIAGAPPSLMKLPPGCSFSPRCPFAVDVCRSERPEPLPIGDRGHLAACHFAQRPGWAPPVELVAERSAG